MTKYDHRCCRGNASGRADVERHGFDARAAAAQFVAARLAATPLSRYPGQVPPDLQSAYQCQELAMRSWPDRLAGWKVARIAQPWQSQYRDERLIGPAFEPNVRFIGPGETVECPVFEGGFAAVEAELVMRLAGDAAADKSQWTLGEAADLVGSLHIGVEIASSPLATLNDLGPGAVVSDFGNNAGVVVGPALRDWLSAEEVVALSFIDDAFVGRGTAFVRHGALGALAFALAKCAQRGRALRAGDVISTGMITGVHDIRVGQRSRHVFESYGEVAVRAVRAQPHSQRAASR